LSEKARRILAELGFTNIEFHVGDGSCGWPAGAPYGGIIVTAGAPEIPPDLLAQLSAGARLVIPVGLGKPQMLQTIIRREQHFETKDVCDCSFVPLVGQEGWPADGD
jgi:protein-L-isoaspartate(D-aspartate) O-methyltransferase